MSTISSPFARFARFGRYQLPVGSGVQVRILAYVVVTEASGCAFGLCLRLYSSACCSCFPQFDQCEVLSAKQYDGLVVLKFWEPLSLQPGCEGSNRPC